MRYVFEVVDDDGAIRTYVVDFIRREADRLVVKYHGLKVNFEISRIRDWCPVSEDMDLLLKDALTRGANLIHGDWQSGTRLNERLVWTRSAGPAGASGPY